MTDTANQIDERAAQAGTPADRKINYVHEGTKAALGVTTLQLYSQLMPAIVSFLNAHYALYANAQQNEALWYNIVSWIFSAILGVIAAPRTALMAVKQIRWFTASLFCAICGRPITEEKDNAS